MPETAVHKDVLFKAILSDEYLFRQQFAAKMTFLGDDSYDAYKARILKRIRARNGGLKTGECSRQWKERKEDGSIERAFKIFAVPAIITTHEMDDEIVRINLWANPRKVMHFYHVRRGEDGSYQFLTPEWDMSYFRKEYWMDRDETVA